MRIMHSLAVELRAAICRMLTSRREVAVIALPVVQVVIHMPVKTFTPMKPRPRANEDATVVPLGPIVSVRRTLIRRSLIVTIRAIWLSADFDRYLRRRRRRCRQEQARCNRHPRNQLENLHSFPLVLEGERNRERLFQILRCPSVAPGGRRWMYRKNHSPIPEPHRPGDRTRRPPDRRSPESKFCLRDVIQ